MKYFKIYFHGSREPQIVLGRTRSQVSRDYKEIFGHDAIDEVDPISRQDAEDDYGDDYEEIIKFNTRTESAPVSVLSGYNPFVRSIAEADDEENTIKLKVDQGDKEEETPEDGAEQEAPMDPADAGDAAEAGAVPGEEGEEGQDGDVQINPDSPDANGDGVVDAKDDLNGDGVVDAKDLKIAQLAKDLKIKELLKAIEDLDDPAPEEKMQDASRLRLKDLGDKFVAIDDHGDVIEEFPYDNENTFARQARFEGQRFIEKNYQEQMGNSKGSSDEKGKEEDPKDAEDMGDEEDPKAAEGDDSTADEAGEDKDGDGVDDSEEEDTNGDGQHDEKDHEESDDEEDKKKKVKESYELSESKKRFSVKFTNGNGAGKWKKGQLEVMTGPNPQTIRRDINKRFPGAEVEIKLMESTLQEALDRQVLKTLQSMDPEEAKIVIQGLPKKLQRDAYKALGIKETVDGRTKAYKETAQRLVGEKKKDKGEDDEPPFEKPYRKSGTYKDRYGNTVKDKNVAKHLAKKGMRGESISEDATGDEEEKFHQDLDKLVHKTFGNSEVEKQQEGKKYKAPTKDDIKKDKLKDAGKGDRMYGKMRGGLKEAGYNDAEDKDYVELAKDLKSSDSVDNQGVPMTEFTGMDMYAEYLSMTVPKTNLSELGEASYRAAFVNAARKAKAEGKKEFEFNGKTYKVTIK